MNFFKEECLIAYETPTGEYLTIRCFNNGSINGVGKLLSERYNDSTSALKIVSMGNLEGLGVSLNSEDYCLDKGKAKYYDVCGEFIRVNCEKAQIPTKTQKMNLLDIFNHLRKDQNSKSPNKKESVDDIYIYASDRCWLHRFIKNSKHCVEYLKDEINKTFSKTELENYKFTLQNLDRLEPQSLDFLCYDAFGETYDQIKTQINKLEDSVEHIKTSQSEINIANDIIEKQNKKLSVLMINNNINNLKFKSTDALER